MRTTRWKVPIVAFTLVVLLASSACGSDKKKSSDTTSPGGSSDKNVAIRIAPQQFGENETLSEVYSQYLKAKGFSKATVQRASSAFRDGVYPALKKGSADLTIDYTGSAASYLDKTGKPSPDANQTFLRLLAALRKTAPDLVALPYAKDAEDKNAFVVMSNFATTNHLTTVSDVKPIASKVTFGASPQCPERTDCLLGYKKVYGLKFKAVKAVTYGPPLVAGLLSGDLQAIQYQTTGPEIVADELKVLTEDKGIFSADNVVPVLSKTLALNSAVTKAINELTTKITTKDMTDWNVRTDLKKDDPKDVAAAWLSKKGLT
ncbi:MAG: ABC transporter substrate-binding protein [Actinomycetota bacterium]|nr:ABC transporter substrate-binding protein [Actinomycetota bacterium]